MRYLILPAFLIFGSLSSAYAMENKIAPIHPVQETCMMKISGDYTAETSS